jgi:hypothetical protein
MPPAELGSHGGGTVNPAVSDGVYIMLAPLQGGPHTINFKATAFGGSFNLDVTYRIRVVNH